MARYIDADALITNANAIESLLGIGLDTVRDFIKNAPTADVVEVVHGEWKHTVTGYPYCSNCNWMPEEDEMLHTNYFCPNCGADMRGGDAK